MDKFAREALCDSGSPSLRLRPIAHDVEIGFLQMVFPHDARRVGEGAKTGVVAFSLPRVRHSAALGDAVGGVEADLHVLSMSAEAASVAKDAVRRSGIKPRNDI
jgi:hypothetical protein